MTRGRLSLSAFPTGCTNRPSSSTLPKTRRRALPCMTPARRASARRSTISSFTNPQRINNEAGLAEGKDWTNSPYQTRGVLSMRLMITLCGLMLLGMTADAQQAVSPRKTLTPEQHESQRKWRQYMAQRPDLQAPATQLLHPANG